MAQNQANFGLNFRVDKSGLNDLKKSLQDIMKLGQQKSATGNLEGDLKEACQAAQKLETILNGAWNSKLGQLNLDKVNQGIKQTYHSVENLQNVLGKVPQGQAAFNKMASQVLNTNLQLKQTNKLLDDMATSMANTVKWGITSSIFNNMTRSVQDAFYYVKGLNSSLTDIRIVTGASADQMASFAEKANAAAKALGQTTRNYTDASLIYYQQGLSEADVEARTQTTLKAANVTGQSTAEVSELLTSVWNGYKVSAAEAELYIDKIAAVATTTASDLEELSVGMSKVASAASLMGVDIDQLNAQLATIISVTRQAPESVGTALKTIYARMGDIEAGLDGETTLGNYTAQMKEMGFNVLDAQGKLRDMGSVIEEIGGKWSSMTREQQLSLAQTVAGTRQYNNLLALFDNWDMYTNALNTSSQAMGTLQEQQDMYLESTGAKLKQLQTELESTYSSMLNTDTLNAAIDDVTQLVEAFNGFIDGLGGGGKALAYFGSMAANVFSKQIGASIFQTIQNIKSVKTNLEAFKAKEKFSKAILNQTQNEHLAKGEGKLDDSALAKEAQYAQKTLQVRKALTDEQYKQFTAMQAEIGVREKELNYLREYKNLSNTIMDYDDASTQALEERLALEEKLLSSRKARKDQTSQELKNYERVQPEGEEDTDYLQERLGTLGNIVATEEEYVQLETILDKLATGKNLKEEENALILELESRVVQEQAKLVQQLKQAIEGKKAAEDGTLELLEEQQQAQEELLRQEQKHAEKQAILQTAVKAIGAALEIGIPLVEGLSKGFDESASGAEKLNGLFAAGTGTLAGIADMLLPGSGIIVQGVATIAQTVLETVGLWDKWEYKLSSTEEKLAELNEATTKNRDLQQDTSQKIASLKEVEEEYLELSNIAGKYGQHLDLLTEEEQNRYIELTNTFASYNKEIIIGYDEQGNAIVKNQEAIKETIALLEEQTQAEMRANLGNVSEKIATQNQNIKDKQTDVTTTEAEYQEAQGLVGQSLYDMFITNQDTMLETGSIEDLNTKLSVSNIANVLFEYGEEVKNLKDDVSSTIVEVDGAIYSIDELAERALDLASSLFMRDGAPSEEEFNEFLSIFDTLDKIYTQADNYKLKEEKANKSAASYKDDGIYQFYRNLKKTYETEVTFLEDTTEALRQKNIAAQTALEEAQALDTNFILSVIQAGEGYDLQWNNLSAEARAAGLQPLIQYIESLNYEDVLKEIQENEGNEDQIYEFVLAKTQDYIRAFGEMYDLASSSVEQALKDADLENFDGTALELENKIVSIIDEVLSKLKDSEELQTEEARLALTEYFKEVFSLDNLEIDFEEGSVEDVVTDVEALYIDARDKIGEFLANNELYPVDKGGGLSSEWLQGILDEEQVKNIDNILANFNLMGYGFNGENLEALGRFLQEAANATEKAESAMSKYNGEMETHKDILQKFEDKERLTDVEMAYLETLEAENAELNKYSRGSEKYIQAFKKAESIKTKAYKEELKRQRDQKQDELKFAKEHLATLDDEDVAYKDTQDIINGLESDIQSIDYELNVVLVAEPSIKDQINNLYSEADTLLTIRTTLEKDEGLSDDQTTALGDFFAATEGRQYLSEYLDTGVLTDEMLTAAEAFAEGKMALAEQSRESLKAEAEELTAAADTLMKEGEELFNEGSPELAIRKKEEADNLYDEAASIAAEEARYGSEDAEREQQAFETEMEGFGLKADEVEDLADAIQDMADESDELADSLEEDEEAAKKLSKELKKYDKALESISKNNTKWQKALESDSIEEQAEAIDEMDKAYSDLLDLDYGSLSKEFLTNADNLALMKEAAENGGEAYNQLQSLAQQDIITHCKFNIDDFNENAAIVQSEMDRLNFEELEIGASLNDEAFLNALTNMVNASNMTAQQATSFLSSMGIDAEVVEDTTTRRDTSNFVGAVAHPTVETIPGTDPLTGEDKVFSVPSITYSAEPMQAEGEKEQTSFALKVTSANKSSGGGFKHSNSGGGGRSSGGGGGGGGGGGKGKAAKKVAPRKKNYYHKVNNSLTKLGNEYEKLAALQDKTFGQKHIDNIKKVNKNIDDQIAKMRERIKIANTQEKKDLKKDIQKNFKKVKFNKDGTIKNYEEVLKKYYKKYANKDQSAEDQERAKEKYDKLKELLDDYEALILETIPGWEAEIREKLDEKFDNQVRNLEYEINLKVRAGDSEREYKEFLHEISDYTDDFFESGKFEQNIAKSIFNSGELKKQTNELDKSLTELDKINKALQAGKDITKKGDESSFSKIWGDNKEGLMEYIATMQGDLVTTVLRVYEARDNAYDNYLNAIDESIDKMDKHLSQYDKLTDQLDYSRNLIELLYGEEADQLGDIYTNQHLINVESLKGHQTALKYAKERDAQLAARLEKEAENNRTNEDGSISYSDEYKKILEAKEQSAEEVENLEREINEITISSVENLLAEYQFLIGKTFRDINKANFGVSNNEMTTEWDLLNKKAEQYLDATNAAFETQKLEAKVINSLNNTDNIKAQQKLKTVMDEQLQILEQKDKLSQYDIDRANLIYDLTLKQIALEEAQQNKSKMRLRRDAQGNYSYQFSADADLIKQTQQELLDVQQQLYNLDKEEYKKQLDVMAGYYQEWQEKLAEAAQIADKDERDRQIARINDSYTLLMESAAQQSQLAKTNLNNLVEGPLADFYQANKDITIGKDGIASMFSSVYAKMGDQFAGENGVSKIVDSALQTITTAASNYHTKLGQIKEASEGAFEKMENVNAITTNIGSITTATEELGEQWKIVLTSVESFITKIGELLKNKTFLKALEVLKKSEQTEQNELNPPSNGNPPPNTSLLDIVKTNASGMKNAIEQQAWELDRTLLAKKGSTNKKLTKGDKVKVVKKYAKDKAGGKLDQTELVGKTAIVVAVKTYKKKQWAQVADWKTGKITGWVPKSRLTGYDTGGYTGNWNSKEGKVALLHQKELVLNQQDTKNILDAVNIIRGLSGVLQSSMINRIEGLTQSLNNLSLPTIQNNSENAPQSIEQTVHITAEFPGVAEAIQIETALNSLVNRANQYALRRE